MNALRKWGRPLTDTVEVLRQRELSPNEFYLWRLLSAYRPHDTPYSRKELREEGLERVEEESFLDELIDRHGGKTLDEETLDE